MPKLTLLLVGDTSRAEFREACASLERMGRVEASATIEVAGQRLADGQLAPDVIVIAQSFPGQFSAEDIDRLRRRAPLARVLGLLGSWCEGETRTGKPWPAAIRVYWHQWLPRAEQELGQLAAGCSSSWSLPLTASEEERFLALAEQPVARRAGRVAIAAAQWETCDWLAGVCRYRGYTTTWLRPPYEHVEDEVDVAIFDTTECQGEELNDLRRLVAQLQPAPVVALLDFPRVEDRDRVLAAGAVAMLSKPLLVEDLFWQLDHIP